MTLSAAISACVLLMTSPLVLAEIYRCERSGQAVFTDTPCDTDAAPLQVQSPNLIDAGLPSDLVRQHDERLKREHKERHQADARWLQAHKEASAQEERLRKAIADGRVIKGMSSAQVQQVWGEPTEIQSNDKGERWVYQEKRRRRTVSFVDGRVTAVSGARARP